MTETGQATKTNGSTGQLTKDMQNQNLIVALRIRPMNEDEIIQGATPIAHRVDKNMVVLMDPADDPDDILRANRSREKQFVFDLALDGATTQSEIYDHTCKFLIPSVIEGYNATVFAYGATGAGKTYTMLGTDDDPGIMARALSDLFRAMDQTREDMAYACSMSYLEIYNEMIRDLLNPSAGYLDLREDAKGVQVSGLSEVTARSSREVMDMLILGNKMRTQEPTAANKTSSRSHAVLQVTVKQRHRVRNVSQEVRVGKLFLIDLAGSERAANTHNRGKRMLEGAHINRSLLALGNCINALSDPRNGGKYVNYRDSKLTRLLKDALGGNCKTVMIAHISPASIHFEESRNTLGYADRAKNIKTKVRRNVTDVTYHIAQYTNIISELREEVKRLRHKLDQQAANSRNSATLRAIQNELHGSSRVNRSPLENFKEKLLATFKDQMELRRTLMEINNSTMELSLESTKNRLLINRWDREKCLPVKQGNAVTAFEDLDAEEKELLAIRKQEELSGESPGSAEVEEVEKARQDLQNNQLEIEKLQYMQRQLQKELDNAKEKAIQIEEILPQKVNNRDQKEILSLMCKVHELEIENMEMQSSCLLRDFELRKTDMITNRYEENRNLCDEIIQQQRAIIHESSIDTPKDLEELYILYQQDFPDFPIARDLSVRLPPLPTYKTSSVTNMSRKYLEADSMSDLEKLSAVEEANRRPPPPPSLTGGTNSVARKQLLRKSSNLLIRQEDKTPEKMFSHSSRAREIREAQMRTDAVGVSKSSSSLNQSPTETKGTRRQQSIVTLSDNKSDRSVPSPVAPPIGDNVHLSTLASTEDRDIILSHTRSIAALAARKKTEANVNVGSNDAFLMPDDPLTKTYTSMKVDPRVRNREKFESDNYLSQSRLAIHDKKYAPKNPAVQQLMRDDRDHYSNATTERQSYFTEPVFSRPQNRAKYRNKVAPKKKKVPTATLR